MDDRQTNITEGAGLQESRLNTEFIDWLNKWSPVALTIVLVGALAWIGLGMWKKYEIKQVDAAFEQYDAALATGSPENLLRVADDWKGRRAVYQLATSGAADIYLNAGQRGLAVAGDAFNEEDWLTDEQRNEHLEQAARLYQDVIDFVGDDKKKLQQKLYAMGNLAAAQLTLGEIDAGRSMLAEVNELARSNGLNELADWNDQRLARLDEILAQPPLLPENEIYAVYSIIPIEPEELEEAGDEEGNEPAPAIGPAPAAAPAESDPEEGG